MFGDCQTDWERITGQRNDFETWCAGLGLGGDTKIAIVEIGAGKSIPTVRHQAETFACSMPNSSLIRINWDDSDIDVEEMPELTGRCFSVGGIGAKDALTIIDNLLSTRSNS